jgi:hypothetical protein
MPYAAVYVYIACVIAHGRYVWVEGSRLLNREPMVGAVDGSAGMVKAMRPCGQGEAHKGDVGRSTSLPGGQDGGMPSLSLPLANSLHSYAPVTIDCVNLAAPGSAGQSASGIICLEPEGIEPHGRCKCLDRTCSNGARAGFGSRAARVARHACRPGAAQTPTYRQPPGNGHHLGFLKEPVRPLAVSPCPPLPSAVEAVTHSKSHSALLLRPPLTAAEKP